MSTFKVPKCLLLKVPYHPPPSQRESATAQRSTEDPHGEVEGVITQPAAHRVDERAATQAVEVLTLLFGPPRDYAIRLWNGAVVGTAGSRFVLALNHPGAPPGSGPASRYRRCCCRGRHAPAQPRRGPA